MRLVLICASLCFLTGCASEHSVLRHALRTEIEANPRAVGILIAVLISIIIVLLLAVAVSLRRRRNPPPPERRSFPDWLASVPGTGADLQDLKTYARAVHWTTNDINTLRQTIENDPVISQADKVRRASTLGAFYERWQRESSYQAGGFLDKLMPYVFDNGIGIFLSFFAVAVFLVLAVGMSNSSFFSSLAQVDQARGLITFLVAISAVAVILLTAINIFWGNTQAEFKERFTAAKDLVTLVVGVLGTILGFYFGSVSSDHLLQLSFDKPGSYSSVSAGSNIPVTATAKNGVSPFNFDLLVLDAQGNLISKDAENKQSDKAFISQDIKAPPKPGNYSIVLLLRDSKGQQTKSTVDFIVKDDAGTSTALIPKTAPTGPPGQKDGK
jgi:hypothetical protein